MDKEKLQRKEKPNIPICIVTTEKISKWLREKNYSPTAIFNEAVKDLGYKAWKTKMKLRYNLKIYQTH